MSEDQCKRWEVYYRGRVQGVGFRYTARQIASRYAVTGYVRNLPDGRVFLVAEALPGELDRFLEEVQADLGHYMIDVSRSAGPASGEFHHFEIRF